MDKKATRDAFGEALLELGKKNPKVVALCADLTGSLKMNAFKEAFPERFFQAGIAEANMIGVAAGLATTGYIPFAGTFAVFGTGRVYDQIRQAVAYSHKNVKIACSHAGLTLGEDGATHQMLEDIALMRALPNMTVVAPCDANQTFLATMKIAEIEGPVYLRFGRPKWYNFTDPQDPEFQIGKAQVLKKGKHVTIFSYGHLVYYSLQAAQELEKENISAEVINVHTLKPLDKETIIASLMKTGGAVIAEEHQKYGGLGSAVAELAAEHYPVPMEFVAVRDTFGESGKPVELLEKYGLSPQHIIKAVKNVFERK